jgi:dihydroorotase
MTEQLTLTRPDDWHVHLRDDGALAAVLPDTARRFGRALVMPNLKPPVTTVRAASGYHQRILDLLPSDTKFVPLMTLYLTEATPPEEIGHARRAGFIPAVKYYPAGATTHSEAGVTDIRRCEAVLSAMEDAGMVLCVHGEIVDPAVDVFDREAVFIERVLAPLLARHPRLRVVFEHITTREAVAFVTQGPATLAATITAHHLLLNRNAMFSGGIRPHHYCLPVLKRELHRRALVEAAISGNAKFFLGTDSAPHAQGAKESSCGCAGIYTAHAGIELYAEAFEQAGALGRLEAFASFHGADFYALPRNTDTLTLQRASWLVPESLDFGQMRLIPMRAGAEVHWSLA